MKHTTIINVKDNDESGKKVSLVDGYANDLQITIENHDTDHYIDLYPDEVTTLRDNLSAWLISKTKKSALIISKDLSSVKDLIQVITSGENMITVDAQSQTELSTFALSEVIEDTKWVVFYNCPLRFDYRHFYTPMDDGMIINKKGKPKTIVDLRFIFVAAEIPPQVLSSTFLNRVVLLNTI